MNAPARTGTLLSVLGPDEIRAIHDASLRVLSETGVHMPLAPERQAQARELGLLVESETHRVRFPPALVAEALDRAPSSYTLCARNRKDDVLLDGKRSHLALDGSAVQLLDPETGEIRSSTRVDLERAVRLADALDPVSILCPALFDRMPLEAWKEAGRPTALSRARERAREILETHQPEPLRCEQQIQEIVSARARSQG